ncbi:hypothetical protein OX88_21585 [Pseudomonas coronafaciens pv. porri]|uniref:hypothetical protein n=1 Tax=Pseudomonas coronafaciens TaxID=53409 RepID=UPI0006ABA7EF|nr:hypothetical protein [Pseudomonas coronafaciens]KOP53082.1 hypothetical protein OX88_21585 [Pseudomonas coronafaciens pv. porri]
MKSTLSKKVEFSQRDKKARTQSIQFKFEEIVKAKYKAERIWNFNEKTVKQASLLTENSFFITRNLKAYVIKDGNDSDIKGNHYKSYIPMKLITFIENVMKRVFGETVDLDNLTNEQILTAEKNMPRKRSLTKRV